MFSLIRFRTATLQIPNNDADFSGLLLVGGFRLASIVPIIDVKKLARRNRVFEKSCRAIPRQDHGKMCFENQNFLLSAIRSKRKRIFEVTCDGFEVPHGTVILLRAKYRRWVWSLPIESLRGIGRAGRSRCSRQPVALLPSLR